MNTNLMTRSEIAKQSVEDLVNTFLMENPDLAMALEQGVANVSQLAKLISNSKGGLNLISVRAALNRIRERNTRTAGKNKADDLLKRSKISLQDKVSAVKSTKTLQIKYISATFLENSVVYIVDEMSQKLPNENENVKIDGHVSMLHIYSPRDIESTPGFIMRITHKLYARGINILQLISCANETILILNKDVCVAAYEILSAA